MNNEQNAKFREFTDRMRALMDERTALVKTCETLLADVAAFTQTLSEKDRPAAAALMSSMVGIVKAICSPDKAQTE